MTSRETLLALDEALSAGLSVCWTALVETRGSTPQKAGAAMLVYADGSQFGTLGGGCVEAEVKRKALQILQHGERDVLTFQLDSDYGWDDGLICGGRMKMLIDPVREDHDRRYFREYAQRLRAGAGLTEAVQLDGLPTCDTPQSQLCGFSASVRPGDRWLFDDQGRCIASRSGVAAPTELMPHLKPLVQRPRPYVVQGWSFLPSLPRCRLVIVGAGHVGQKVAEYAADVDFNVWVIDDREEYASAARFPQAERRIVGTLDAVLPGLPIDSQTYCIIVTRGHHHDEEALQYLAERPAAYVGLIGSRRKIKLILADLLQAGVSAAALERVRAPLGFGIGSQTVPEIAISILAELIAERNLGQVPERVRPASLLPEVRAATATRGARSTEPPGPMANHAAQPTGRSDDSLSSN
jgi:xanthine dehydrogenase accessory factor